MLVLHLNHGNAPVRGCVAACGIYEVDFNSQEAATLNGELVTCGACRSAMAEEVEKALDNLDPLVIDGLALDKLAENFAMVRHHGERDSELRFRLKEALLRQMTKS